MCSFIMRCQVTIKLMFITDYLNDIFAPIYQIPNTKIPYTNSIFWEKLWKYFFFDEISMSFVFVIQFVYVVSYPSFNAIFRCSNRL